MFLYLSFIYYFRHITFYTRGSFSVFARDMRLNSIPSILQISGSSFLFNDELKNVLELDKINSCTMFEKLFLKALDKHAPVKKKVVRANHAKYISKPLRKAIMKRSYLEKIYFKKKRQLSHWRNIRNKKTIVVGCIKKKEKNSLTT